MERSNLPLVWVQDLDGTDAIEKFKTQLMQNVDNQVLKKMYKILEVQYKALERKEIKESYYDDPSWAYKQAFTNGQRMSLQATMDLLSFVKEKDAK